MEQCRLSGSCWCRPFITVIPPLLIPPSALGVAPKKLAKFNCAMLWAEGSAGGDLVDDEGACFVFGVDVYEIRCD